MWVLRMPILLSWLDEVAAPIFLMASIHSRGGRLMSDVSIMKISCNTPRRCQTADETRLLIVQVECTAERWWPATWERTRSHLALYRRHSSRQHLSPMTPVHI